MKTLTLFHAYCSVIDKGGADSRLDPDTLTKILKESLFIQNGLLAG